MADRATRVMGLIARLQDAVEAEHPEKPFVFLTAHQADVLELAEFKGNAMVEQYLNFKAGTVSSWRTQYKIADGREDARRKAAERREELDACMGRLRQDMPALQTMQPTKWLDQHQADVVEVLTSGMPFLRLAHELGLIDTTLRQWCHRRGVISPRSRGKRPARRILRPRKEKPQEDTPPTVEPPSEEPDWHSLSSEELQQVVAQDILSMGQEEAYRLWMGRGMPGQHWASLLRVIRAHGLLPTTDDEPSTPTERAWYYQGKYEALREILAMFAQGGNTIPQPPSQGEDDAQPAAS